MRLFIKECYLDVGIKLEPIGVCGPCYWSVIRIECQFQGMQAGARPSIPYGGKVPTVGGGLRFPRCGWMVSIRGVF